MPTLRTLARACLLVAPLVLAPSALAQTYSYDAIGRLTQVTYAGGTTITYGYDAAGNVTSNTVTPQPPAGGGGPGGGGGGGGGGGCFIATAAYGSALHPHVAELRTFRDERLLTNAPGTFLVQLYYDTSPPLAAVIAEHDSLRFLARLGLAPLVYAVVHPWASAVFWLAALGLALRLRRRLRERRAASRAVLAEGSAS